MALEQALNLTLLQPPHPEATPHWEMSLTQKGVPFCMVASCMVLSRSHKLWGFRVLMCDMRGLGCIREGPGKHRGPPDSSVFGAGVGVLTSFPSQQSNSALIYLI